MTKLNLKWTGTSKGNGVYKRESDNEKLTIAIPVESGGSGEGFAPRELLASSAGACFSLTLVSLMDVRKLPLTEFSMDTEVTKEENQYKIIHYPKVVLSNTATEKDYAAVERAIALADKRCSIGNLLKEAGVELSIEAEIIIQ